MSPKEESATTPAWSIDEVAFKVIKTNSLSHDHLTKQVGARGLQHRPSTLLYDALALKYNETALGELLIVALPNRPSSSNLNKTIKARGLKEDDYRVFRPWYDERGQRLPKHKRPLVLQRISEQTMRTIQPFPALAESISRDAEQRGASFDFARPESRVMPGTT